MVISHAVAVEDAGVGSVVQAADLGGENPLRRHESRPRRRLGEHLGRLHGRVVAVVVEHQDALGRRTWPDSDVPGGDDEIVAGFQHVGVRHAAGGDEHHVRLLPPARRPASA